jgi:hypothetical protein
MAICTWCTQEMLTAMSCSVEVLHHSGVAYALPRYGDEMRSGRWPRPGGRCGDCAVLPGGFHHLGCDAAECPCCDGQLLSCGCRYDEDGPDEDEEDQDDEDELAPEDAARVSIDRS